MIRLALILLALLPQVLAAQQALGPSTGGTVALRQAERMLGHNKRALMIAAHPDDEDTELLTVLVRSQGAEAAYLSLSRGEGGQNLIGPELGEELGLIRSEELLAARVERAKRLDAGEPMPAYLRDHAVYYAGPAKTPAGYASGSFGPTTAGRMDSYVEQFQAAGGSMVMLAKGNRSKQVTEACGTHGGFYLGSIGGAAANLAEHCIKKVETVEYPELGMEAIWRIEVEDFPAFIVTDDKGNDFFAGLS